MAYDAHVTALACLKFDPRPIVVVGGVDSGVPNRLSSDRCTVNDLIKDDEPWPNHGMFVRHVEDVTDPLVAAEVISSRERGQIIRAAARSDVGGPPWPS